MVTLLYNSCQWPLALFMYACHYLWLITGRGVFATRSFLPGDFVLEYRGKLLNALPNSISDTYLFEFFHNGKRTWYVLMFMFVHWCSHWAHENFCCSLLIQCSIRPVILDIWIWDVLIIIGGWCTLLDQFHPSAWNIQHMRTYQLPTEQYHRRPPKGTPCLKIGVIKKSNETRWQNHSRHLRAL